MIPEKLDAILNEVVLEDPKLENLVRGIKLHLSTEDEPKDEHVLTAEAGIALLTEEIRKAAHDQAFVIVNIAGGSGSGKSSIARAVQGNFASDELKIVDFDSYYLGQKYIDEHPYVEWDHPASLDLELFRHHLDQLSKGQTVMMPLYSIIESRRIGFEKFAPAPIMIVDGLFSLRDEFRSYAHMTAFVEASLATRLQRRLIRDRHPGRAGMSYANTLRFAWRALSVMHNEHVQPTRKHAQTVIDNNANREQL